MLTATKNKAGKQLSTAQELLNVEAIQGNVLRTKDKHLFAYIQCRGADNSLLNDKDNEQVTERLTLALSEETLPLQILTIPRTVDTKGMIHELKELRQKTQNDMRLRLLTGEISALEELAADGAKEPLIILKIWASDSRDAERGLIDRAAALVSKLSENSIAAMIFDEEHILHLCSIYAELGIWQPEEVPPSDIPMLPQKKRLFSRKVTPEQQAYNELMEQITPAGGFSFSANSFYCGAALCRCYGVTRYPAELNYGWAVKLMSATDCITCITYNPSQASEIGDALSRSIRASSREAVEENDTRRRKRAERKASDAGRLIDDLDARGKALGHISILVMPWAEDAKELDRICRNITSRFAVRQMKLKLLSCVQMEAFKHLSPYHPNQPVIDDIVQRIIPLETMVGGYPMTINTLRDDHGVYFARTADQGIVSLDIRYRGADRTNGNGVVTGVPGVGKSTLLKSLLESMYMLGIRCIVIDPEREFKDLCLALGGSWLDAGGGSAKVNLLQVQTPILDDAKNPDLRSQENPLSQHVQHVKTVLRYKLPCLTDLQMALLEKALLELYEKFGITLNKGLYYRSLKNKDYPIMEDFWKYLQEKQQEDDRYGDLALLLESMAVGADSSIWNGHTNIDLKNRLVVLDTNRLSLDTDRNRVSQYYNLMRWVFTAMSGDRTTPYMIIGDEAQTIFDPELPQAAQAMKNIALRCRKYEGYLWLAFHSLHELLDDRVRLYGQPILDAATYKILFGTDGRNLADTVSLFNLTESEEKTLEAKLRGKALALIGNRHMRVNFDIPRYKLDLMGAAGGR